MNYRPQETLRVEVVNGNVVGCVYNQSEDPRKCERCSFYKCRLKARMIPARIKFDQRETAQTI